MLTVFPHLEENPKVYVCVEHMSWFRHVQFHGDELYEHGWRDQVTEVEPIGPGDDLLVSETDFLSWRSKFWM